MPAPMLSRAEGMLLAAPHASTMPSSLSGPLVGGAAVSVGAASAAAERPFPPGALLVRLAVGVTSSADSNRSQPCDLLQVLAQEVLC